MRIQVSGIRLCIFLMVGGWLSGATRAESIQLTLEEAIRVAISEQGSNSLKAAKASSEETRARTMQRRAALLPHFDVSAYQRRQTVNLESFGLGFEGLIPIPRLVGPFSTFDARAEVRQSVFDLESIRGYRSARSGQDAAETGVERVKDEIAFAVAVQYLNALRSRSRLESARSEVELAEELLELAENRKASGTGVRVEVTRAEVQLADRRRRLIQGETQYSNDLLKLARGIGLDLSVRVELSDSLEPDAVSRPDLADALAEAFENRLDLRRQLQLEKSLRERLEAAQAGRIPSLSAFANYGSSGLYPNDSIPTWTAGMRLDIPLFDGGATSSRVAEARAQLRREEIRTADLRQEIELDVRVALNSLLLAGESVEVAKEGLRLARQELEEARRRYDAGVTISIEVTDAQTRLQRADESRIDAIHQLRMAHLALDDAVGALRVRTGMKMGGER